MNRVTITLSDDLFKKIEGRRQEKSLSSAAQCMRELIELAWRIEEIAKNSAAEKDKASEELQAILEIKELLKKNMIWSMETRMLARVLVKYMEHDGPETNNKLLAMCKEKATAHVKGFLKEALE